MPIDFFSGYKTSSSIAKFGLRDDPPPSLMPAYIDEVNIPQWIGIVNNSSTMQTDFYAIDRSIVILRSDGCQEQRCDGLLRNATNLIFVELKDRKAKGWLAGGREQLTVTIKLFMINHNISTYGKVAAYVCNKQRPSARVSHAQEIQQFYNDTGLILRVQQEISI